LHEGVRDVAFEGKVLTRYGTFDRIPNQAREQSSYRYLHCDVLDKEGYTTITVSVMFHLVDQHETKFKVGCYVRIENFGIKPKSLKGFEKGDMPFVIRVLSATIVSFVANLESTIVPKFYHMDTITDFWDCSHENWASATIVAVVISIRGEFEHTHQLQIADNLTEYDQDVVALGPQYQKEYEQIVKAFNNGQCVMVLFKNITYTSIGDRHLRCEIYTILSTVIDESVRQYLGQVYLRLGTNNNNSSHEVSFS
jgi:hypothetical protein